MQAINNVPMGGRSTSDPRSQTHLEMNAHIDASNPRLSAHVKKSPLG